MKFLMEKNLLNYLDQNLFNLSFKIIRFLKMRNERSKNFIYYSYM